MESLKKHNLPLPYRLHRAVIVWGLSALGLKDCWGEGMRLTPQNPELELGAPEAA